ncbi:MAG: phage portal protein [Paludibacteraceae bacterium]|nr:phage portal protein [Paludibacteraceae bacterium]
MFYLNKDTPLTPELLKKMLRKFIVDVQPKLEKYKNYYDGKQAILNKQYSDPSKPCNKTVTNYCQDITDSYCGYIATPGHITYSAPSDDIDITDIMDTLKYNDYQDNDAEFLLNALQHGVAAELMFTDPDSKVRFRQIDPRTCFGVYDDSLTGDLMYFVRMYKLSDWDDSDTYCVDVYDSANITHYTMHGMSAEITLALDTTKKPEPHYFSQCPANIFYLKDEKSIFDCIMSNQDTYNALLSAEVDDYEAFCDAYLTLEGGELDPDQVAEMKANRVLQLPEGCKASWLTKQPNDTQIENILKRLHTSIYRTAKCVDFSSESFTTGVSSGIAIAFKLTGMETKAGKIEAVMKKALQRRVELICGVASLKLGEEVFRDIVIDFKRNVPADETSQVNKINALRGLVSDETLLGMVTEVEDVEQELVKIEAQKQRNMDLFAGNAFGSTEGEDEDLDYGE